MPSLSYDQLLEENRRLKIQIEEHQRKKASAWISPETDTLQPESMMLSVFDSLSEFVLIIDAKWNIVEANISAKQEIGLPENPPYPEIWTIIDPHSRISTQNVLESNISQTNQYASFIFIDKSGKTKYVEAKIKSGSWNNAPVKIIIATDVTLGVHNRTKYLNLKSWVHKIVGADQALYFCLNTELEITFISEYIQKSLGIDSDKVLGRSILPFIHKTDRERCIQHIYTTFRSENNQSIKIRILSADKSFKWQLLQGEAMVNDQDVVVGYIGVLVTINDLEVINEDIEAVAKFPDENPNPVLRVDYDGNLLYSNKRNKKIDRYIAGQFPTLYKTYFEDFQNKGNHFSVYTELDSCLFQIIFMPVLNCDFINIYVADLTPLKNAEKQIFEQLKELKKQEKKLVEINEFLAKSEHKLNYMNSKLNERKIHLDLFFNYSLEGIFFMMLDEPIEWNDSIDKEKAIDYILEHQYITKANPAILAQYGATEEEFVGLSAKDFFANNLEQERKLWIEFFDKGQNNYITETRKFNGELMWIEGNYKCFYDTKGRITGHFGVQREITKQKQAQEMLTLNGQRLSMALNAAQQGLWDWNIMTNEVFFDENWIEITGLKPEEVIPDFSMWEKIIPHSQLPEIMYQFNSLLASKEDLIFDEELVINTKNDEPLWIQIKGQVVERDEYHVPSRMLGIVQDITTRKKAQIERQMFYEVSLDLLCIADTNLKIKQANQAWEKDIGINISDLTNNYLYNNLFDSDQIILKNALQESLDSKEIKSFDARLLTRTNETLWMSWKLKYNPDDQLVYISGRDVTERIKYENQLKKAIDEANTANKAKSLFLANMSHEIRTPLNAILGYAKILHNILLDEQNREYTEIIRKSAQNLLSLINDILDLARIEAGRVKIEPTPLNITNLINDITDIFKLKANNKGLSFSTVINSQIPVSLLIDGSRFRQVLFNVVGNAVKFTDEGYVNLLVNGTPSADDPERIDLSIAVEDTGIGISENQIDAIFNSFHKGGETNSKYDGTGLGLSICKSLLEMMNGTISVESQIGKGSVFTIKIRNIAITHERHKLPETKDLLKYTMDFNGAQILIVEDNKYNVMLLESMLKNKNIKTISAYNGKEALETLKTEKAEVILMDMRMPVMDGYQTTIEIRKIPEFTQIPIIALTADLIETDKTKILSIGCNNLLLKPINENDLLSILSGYLSPIVTPVQQQSKNREQEKDNDDLISAETLEKIILFLQQVEENEWKIIKKAMQLHLWKEFGTKIANKGKEFNARSLEKFGIDLVRNCENLNIAALKKLIVTFPDLITYYQSKQTK